MGIRPVKDTDANCPHRFYSATVGGTECGHCIPQSVKKRQGLIGYFSCLKTVLCVRSLKCFETAGLATTKALIRHIR